MNVDDTANESLARTPRWAVYQCEGGCVHLRLERQTLTFSPPEFAKFVQMIGDAYVRLVTRTVAAGVGTH